MLTRRELIRGIGIGSLAAGLPAISLARAETNARLVVVILRGAMDGLAMVPAYGDSNYVRLRGELALAAPTAGGALELDGFFGLHPALTNVHALYENREAAIIQAVASPYRERSHFDGQDVLENGVTRAGGRRDGWLNRAIEPLGGALGDEVAIAISQNTPLVLRGENSVTSWAPSQLPSADDGTLERLEWLYANDEFFHIRLAQALDSQTIAGETGGMRGWRRRGDRSAQLASTMRRAAGFLVADDGPRVAVVESGGWDTHANQGTATGALANQFDALDQGLRSLHEGMGSAWAETVVVVVTEFGRTVRVNGTRGTDHGTASAALLLGGAVVGGRVIADWPGLAPGNLLDNRDLYPTLDLRRVFKGLLIAHLGIPEDHVERNVFPDSTDSRPLEDLVRLQRA